MQVRYGGTSNLLEACKLIRSAKSKNASKKEAKIVDYMLSRVKNAPKNVIASVCRAAVRWCDPQLWNRAIELPQLWRSDTSKLIVSERDISSAISMLGFGQIRQGYVFGSPQLEYKRWISVLLFILASKWLFIIPGASRNVSRSSTKLRNGQIRT